MKWHIDQYEVVVKPTELSNMISDHNIAVVG